MIEGGQFHSFPVNLSAIVSVAPDNATASIQDTASVAYPGCSEAFADGLPIAAERDANGGWPVATMAYRRMGADVLAPVGAEPIPVRASAFPALRVLFPVSPD